MAVHPPPDLPGPCRAACRRPAQGRRPAPRACRSRRPGPLASHQNSDGALYFPCSGGDEWGAMLNLLLIEARLLKTDGCCTFLPENANSLPENEIAWRVVGGDCTVDRRLRCCDFRKQQHRSARRCDERR